jgi:hypothetical protein
MTKRIPKPECRMERRGADGKNGSQKRDGAARGGLDRPRGGEITPEALERAAMARAHDGTLAYPSYGCQWGFVAVSLPLMWEWAARFHESNSGQPRISFLGSRVWAGRAFRCRRSLNWFAKRFPSNPSFEITIPISKWRIFRHALFRKPTDVALTQWPLVGANRIAILLDDR